MDKELLNYFKDDELAANVWLSKYAQKGEKTPDNMHKRMAKEFAKIENKYIKNERNYNKGFPSNVLEEKQKLSVYGRNRENLTENSIYELFKDFKYIIPQGSVMSNLGSKAITSLSNCFVIGQPSDSYGGIFQKDEEMVQLMKRRGGVGIDISTLRPRGTNVTNAAKTSTGAVSFMHRFSNSTREVAQDGRRGALMLSININHPDVMDFIKVKRDLTQVTGANISIKLNNEFMKAVENDEDYMLQFPCDKKNSWQITGYSYNTLHKVKFNDNSDGYVKRIKAKEYWNEIIKSAHNVAEPGLMFEDNHLNYSPDGVYEQYKGVTTNPCVTGDTEILTKEGYKEIYTLVDQEVEIWNGFEWSLVTPKITGYNQHMLKVTLSDGRELTSTDYHKWILAEGYTGKFKKVETKDLKIGDKIIKYNFPIIKEGEQVSLKHAYTQGFISAEGMDDYKYFWLYEPKYMCKDRLDIKTEGSEFINFNKIKRKTIWYNDIYKEKSYVPFEWNLTSKIEWLSGLFDGDGTELIEGGLQICSTDFVFLKDLQKLLSTLGINCKVLHAQEEGNRMMPDGNGGEKEYFCQKSYRVCIGAVQMQELKSLGLDCSRMSFDKTPQRDASQFVKIVKIEDAGYEDKVYCFNEPLKHFGIFNGILTGQCGEIFMQEYDACRLIAVNLVSFVDNPFTEEAKFNFDKFYSINYEAMRLSDDLVDLELEHIDKIIQKIEDDKEIEEVKDREKRLWEKIKDTAQSSRRTGLGITALGDCLAALGLRYDSDEALKMIDKIFNKKLESELDCTIDLAILRGSFLGWDKNLEYSNIFINETTKGNNNFYQFILKQFPYQFERMCKYGRRNVSFNTCAPTGTVSLLANNCTGGIEPLFQPYYFRRKKINPNDKDSRVDFVDQNGDSWQEFPVLHPKFKEWLKIKNGDSYIIDIEKANKNELQILFENSPWYNSTANDIDWIKRVEIQSIIQKYITHSISSTINLPSTVSEKEVSNIYMQSWKKGLKGVTVYRDGSRSGVLITENTKNNNSFEYKDAIKRPKTLECDVHTVVSKGVKWNVIIGLLDKKPYEVFAVKHFTDEHKLELTKIKQGRYDLFKNGETYSENITSEMNGEEEVVTRLISTGLRHGTDIKFLVEQLNKTNRDITSFSKSIARTLKKYIPEGAISTVKCSECGSSNVVFKEGCQSCNDCGNSKCG